VYDFGIKAPNFVLGPKVPEANEYYSILASETQQCVAGQVTPEEACNNIKSQIDNLH
jgi:multiple sugar transport system substrate-binding protein